MYTIAACVPAPDKTFSNDPGKKKERSRKLEELENQAQSPLILTHTSSFVDSYKSYKGHNSVHILQQLAM